MKRRGSALDPDILVRQLRLSGPESRVLFRTRVAGGPCALIATPLAGSPGGPATHSTQTLERLDDRP
ncbi:MAG: hypothetical protein HYS12_18405 [Planctomycetes bacterium]|nr:hypothetical protein [Planctomycetota bacterium]